MKRKLIAALAATMIVFTFITGCSNKENKKEITVYTALEEDIINQYLEDYEKNNPDIEVNIVRDSTGVIVSKLKAEKDNPIADVVWGVAATSLLTVGDELEPYSPKGVERVLSKFKDLSENPKWVGMNVTEAGFTVNTEEIKKLGLDIPKSYSDLIKPEYKGLITMPNPVSSGTGFLMVAGLIETMEEEKAFEYLDKLNENVSIYTHSGSKPAVNASKGEFPIGLSILYRGIKEKSSGSPVEVIFPEEGLMWDVEANALVKKDEIKDEAKEFLDWAISDSAMKEYQKNYPIITIDNDYKLPDDYPEDSVDKLVNIDFNKIAIEKENITDKWSKKYDSKSEKNK